MIINQETLKICKTNYIDLNELAYLYFSFTEQPWILDISPASINKLERMGLLENNQVTVVGENLIAELHEPQEIELQVEQGDFEEFWKTYPRDDAFRHFGKTRTLRWNKQESKKEYQACLRRTSHENIMKALRNEIAYRETSERENLFKYMKSSINWLKTDHWYEFLDEDLDLGREKDLI